MKSIQEFIHEYFQVVLLEFELKPFQCVRIRIRVRLDWNYYYLSSYTVL